MTMTVSQNSIYASNSTIQCRLEQDLVPFFWAFRRVLSRLSDFFSILSFILLAHGITPRFWFAQFYEMLSQRESSRCKFTASRWLTRTWPDIAVLIITILTVSLAWTREQSLNFSLWHLLSKRSTQLLAQDSLKPSICISLTSSSSWIKTWPLNLVSPKTSWKRFEMQEKKTSILRKAAFQWLCKRRRQYHFVKSSRSRRRSWLSQHSHHKVLQDFNGSDVFTFGQAFVIKESDPIITR